MNKELFVSSTPHETKVGLVEDDLLAEVYLERENEYTLAGSIYKGRVTRVLPGMQSAFVDIGLERDAFLYVSDFMELEDAEDLDDVPTNRPVPERHAGPVQAEAQSGEVFALPAIESQPQENTEPGHTDREPSASPESRENRDSMRGRRRRRGRRGERFPESKFSRPGTEGPQADHPERNDRTGRGERTDRTERTDRPERLDRPERSERSGRPERGERTERSEYGPPPGYQPIILPGESISKYQRLAQTRPAAREERPLAPAPDQPVPPVSAIFAGDEPLFAESVQRPTIYAEPTKATRQPVVDAESSDWDRQQKRLREMNVAAVFGVETTETQAQDQDEDDDDSGDHDVNGNRANVSAHAE